VARRLDDAFAPLPPSQGREVIRASVDGFSTLGSACVTACRGSPGRFYRLLRLQRSKGFCWTPPVPAGRPLPHRCSRSVAEEPVEVPERQAETGGQFCCWTEYSHRSRKPRGCWDVSVWLRPPLQRLPFPEWLRATTVSPGPTCARTPALCGGQKRPARGYPQRHTSSSTTMTSAPPLLSSRADRLLTLPTSAEAVANPGQPSRNAPVTPATASFRRP